MIKFIGTIILVFNICSNSLASEEFTYCVPVKKVDFNPFRKILDGKDTAYLMLLKSYISEEITEEGILDKFEFSPDGTYFTGRIAKGLSWSDGTLVTPQEAAIGIARGLKFRPLGERVKVEGTEDMLLQDIKKFDFKGIKILDKRTFKITFSSRIENLKGVLREALTTNARHNRLWPVKLSNESTKDSLEVLGKYKIVLSNKKAIIKFDQYNISIISDTNCKYAGFTLYPEVLESKKLKSYSYVKNPHPSLLYIQLNSKKLNLQTRKSLIGFLRSAFANTSADLSIFSVSSFFEIGETGYLKENFWKNSYDYNDLKGKHFSVYISIPSAKKIVEEYAKINKVKLDIITSVELVDDKTDGLIQASAIQEGRLIVLQDITRTINSNIYLFNAPKLRKVLGEISRLSASTIPPSASLLSNFEKVALDEMVYAPLARRYLMAYSKLDLPLYFSWVSKGELTIKLKKYEK